MADSSIQICYFFLNISSVYTETFFNYQQTTKFNKYKTVQKAFGKKPGALGHCYSLLIIWFSQLKKTVKVRACLSFL